MAFLKDVVSALAKAVTTLARPVVWWHLLWPGLVASGLWFGLALSFWTELATSLGQWLGGVYGAGDLSQHGWLALIWAIIGHMLLVTVLVPLVYGTAVFLFGVFAAPLMLERVAARDYAHLHRAGGGRQTGSLVNALWAMALFGLMFVSSLPLWLVPGLAFILPPLLCGWLNQRLYGYDALMAHANAAEFPALRRQCRPGLFVIGVLAALLGWIPIVNLLAPAFAGLASLHYCLKALGQHRLQSRFN